MFSLAVSHSTLAGNPVDSVVLASSAPDGVRSPLSTVTTRACLVAKFTDAYNTNNKKGHHDEMCSEKACVVTEYNTRTIVDAALTNAGSRHGTKHSWEGVDQ